MNIWDIKDQNTLTKLTAKIFLNIEEEKIPNLPLIDFLRLTLFVEEKSLFAANLFKKLQRESKDAKIRAILENYRGSEFGIIARFCKLYPAYTLEQAADLSWVKVYNAFEEDTKINDINEAIAEVRQ